MTTTEKLALAAILALLFCLSSCGCANPRDRDLNLRELHDNLREPCHLCGSGIVLLAGYNHANAWRQHATCGKSCFYAVLEWDYRAGVLYLLSEELWTVDDWAIYARWEFKRYEKEQIHEKV